MSRSTCSVTETSFSPQEAGSEVTWRPRSLREMGSRLRRASFAVLRATVSDDSSLSYRIEHQPPISRGGGKTHSTTIVPFDQRIMHKRLEYRRETLLVASKHSESDLGRFAENA